MATEARMGVAVEDCFEEERLGRPSRGRGDRADARGMGRTCARLRFRLRRGPCGDGVARPPTLPPFIGVKVVEVPSLWAAAAGLSATGADVSARGSLIVVAARTRSSCGCPAVSD